MLPERRNRDREKARNAVSGSGKVPPQKGPEKYGLLKRLVDWIARGANKSGVGGTSCPT